MSIANDTTFAILTNFCEAKESFYKMGDDNHIRLFDSFEVFSVLTFRDMFLDIPRNLKLHVYHANSLPIISAMSSPLNIFMKSKKFTPNEFMHQVVYLNNAVDSSLATCEKLIVSRDEIPELKMYEISSIYMSDESYSALKNLNHKNVESYLMNILKPLLLIVNSYKISKILDLIENFIKVRYSSLYENVNVNMYTPRYYINDIMLKSGYNSRQECVRYEIKSNFNRTLPQYNSNTILTMYWDTKFLYLFLNNIVEKLFNSFNKNVTDMKYTPENLENLKIQLKKIKYNYTADCDCINNDGDDYRTFINPLDFSFRNFHFNCKSETLMHSNHLNMTYCEHFNASYMYSDNINCLSDNHEIVKFNNNSLETYIRNLKIFNDTI